MSDAIAIIGAGQAAARVAETLRKCDVARPIIVIGEETHPPYQRPPLSKKFLLGQVPEEQLLVFPAEFYDRNGIDLRTGQRAIGLDPASRTITLADGMEIPYGTAVLATGCGPRMLPIPGADREGVYALRGIGCVRAIQAALPEAHAIAIIGGGYIGLEVAAVLRQLGKTVTVLEAADRILMRVTGADVAGYLADLHTRHGVTIQCSAQVAELVGDHRISGVRLADSRTIPADLVLIAAGSIAHDGLARDAGLACDDGVLVDATGRTSAETIYAAGDCAKFYSHRYGRHIRLESVQNANDQARSVAEHIAGRPVRYDPVPWFWSDQYDTKLQIAGLSQGHDRSVVTGDHAAGTFAVAYYAGERLLAVDAINSAKAYMAGRRALELGVAKPAAA